MGIKKKGLRYFLKMVGMGGLLYGYVSSLVGMACITPKKMKLVFDTPVRESWFQKALNACTRVWGDIRMLVNGVQEGEHGMIEDQAMFVVDGMIGRLAYAYFCIERSGMCDKWKEGEYRNRYMRNEKDLCNATSEHRAHAISNQEWLRDDICYLDRVLEKIACELAQLPQVLSDVDHSACVNHEVAKIRTILQGYLQSETETR